MHRKDPYDDMTDAEFESAILEVLGTEASPSATRAKRPISWREVDAYTLYILRSAAGPHSDVQPAYLKYHIEELLKEREALVKFIKRIPNTNHPSPWRTGRHSIDQPGPRGRTIYDANGEFVGIMDSKALADRVVSAVNAALAADA